MQKKANCFIRNSIS